MTVCVPVLAGDAAVGGGIVTARSAADAAFIARPTRGTTSNAVRILICSLQTWPRGSPRPVSLIIYKLRRASFLGHGRPDTPITIGTRPASPALTTSCVLAAAC